MCRGKTVKKLVKMPQCQCGRQPSIMGREPMYLVPHGSEYLVTCGGCTDRLLKHFGVKIHQDLMNLFTNAPDYNNRIRKFFPLS